MASSNLWQPLFSELRRRGPDRTQESRLPVVRLPGRRGASGDMNKSEIHDGRHSCRLTEGRYRVPDCDDGRSEGFRAPRQASRLCLAARARGAGERPKIIAHGPASVRAEEKTPGRCHDAAQEFPTASSTIMMASSRRRNVAAVARLIPCLPTTEQRPKNRDPASPRTSAPFRRAPRDRQSPRRRDELPHPGCTRSPGSNT